MPLYKPTLSKYPADIFFETGTFNGEGCQLALDLGFKELHSIELDAGKYKDNCRRFSGMKNVYLYKGASEACIHEVLPKLDRSKSVTFWLDAHPPGNLRRENCPIADELDAILIAVLSGLKVKAVMIDDMRLFSQEDQEWMADRLQQLIPDGLVVRDLGIEDQDVLTVYHPSLA